MLSRISGMEWWNGTLEWNTGMTQFVFNTFLSTFLNHKFEKIGIATAWDHKDTFSHIL